MQCPAKMVAHPKRRVKENGCQWKEFTRRRRNENIFCSDLMRTLVLLSQRRKACGYGMITQNPLWWRKLLSALDSTRFLMKSSVRSICDWTLLRPRVESSYLLCQVLATPIIWRQSTCCSPIVFDVAPRHRFLAQLPVFLMAYGPNLYQISRCMKTLFQVPEQNCSIYDTHLSAYQSSMVSLHLSFFRITTSQIWPSLFLFSVNAADNKQRDPSMNTIKINIDA